MMKIRHQFGLFLCIALAFARSSALSVQKINVVAQLKDGYRQRIEADPSFGLKSVTEVILAAGTQLTAEYERRGPERIGLEIDFVIAGVLTAIYGKYSSMWRTAKTLDKKHTKDAFEPRLGSLKVPSNAFQKYLLDGVTVPTLKQRLASFIVPVPALFRAGVFASLLGYGFTFVLIQLRTVLVPSYVAATQNINILYACLYTGAFMAVVSNIRYQLLQGLIEPFVDRVLRKYPFIRAPAIFGIRTLNGLLGSILAISGMRMLGLQKLK